jgi:hypothetical protein
LLSQKFLKVWFAGELDEKAVEHLKRKLAEALAHRERRVLIRFYLDKNPHESYYDALRNILLSSVSLSIVVEERPASELKKDLERASGEGILLVLGRGALRPSRITGLLVEEVEKSCLRASLT